jgi:type I restriction enzyme S subunit
MYCVKVLSNLSDRLDAEFYNPKAIKTINLMEKNGKTVELGEIIKEGYRVVYHGTDSINGLNSDEILPFLSPTQIGDGGDIDFNKVDYLPLYYKDDYPKGLAASGELLIEVKGNVSKVGIVPSVFPNNLMISGSLYKAKIDEDRMDPHYVLAYLKTKFGQILKDRLTSNTIINYIAKDALYSIPIFEVSYIVQKYIGDKVRQAELLREWAKNIQSKATDSQPVFKKNIVDYKENYFKCNEIFSERLDSQFYHPNNIALDNELKLNNCVKLSHFAKLIKQTWSKDKAQEFLYFEIGGLNINTGLIQPECLNVNDAPSRAKTKVRYADVLVSTVRPNRKNVGFIAIDDSTVEMVATSGFSVLRFEKPEVAAFYHFWLRSDDATSQLMRWNSGSAYPAIDEDVPLNILVPKFEQHLIDEWGKKLLFAQLSYIYAQKLVGFTKFIVEALIEGEITEDHLIRAQNALEQRDNTLDRTILSQMTEEGYAVAGSKQLFADLDEFYELLEQAKEFE